MISEWLGLGCMLLGVLLRRYAIRILGQNFTVDVAIRVDQQVVMTGPYRLVRHPSYSGLLLIFLGIGFVISNWVGILALLILSGIGLAYRIVVEEDALLMSLGEAYQTYATHTKRLIPWVF